MRSNRFAPLFWSASLLFFLSGSTGLAYQVIWFKRFSHVWGNSTLAMAVVLGSFLAGLGLGAYCIGKLADRIHGHLRAYGICEIGIGILAVVIPYELRALDSLSAMIYPALQGQPIWLALVRFALTFCILGPPCFLMGGTLPLLIKHFTRRDEALGPASGWLYAINTLGAACGCFLTGFVLLPNLGIRPTTFAVAALNGLIGAISLVLAWRLVVKEGPASERETQEMSAPTPAPEVGNISSPTLGTLLVAAGITGLAALILEVIWTRQLALILGGSTYAFSAMLTVVLIGIGGGSLAYHYLAGRERSLQHATTYILIMLILTAFLGKLLIPLLSPVVGLLKLMRFSQSANAIICLAVSMVLQLIPCLAMGLLFPLLIQLTRKRVADAGKTVGTLYAVNTLGAIIGAAITALILVPLLGLDGTFAAALGLYTLALLLLFPPLHRKREALGLFIACLLAGAAVFFSTSRADPIITNQGMFLYGPTRMSRETNKILHFEEGASANVLLTQRGEIISLRVNGKVEASNFGDMPTQLGVSYFPLFHVPEAQRVLVIGFGSGTSAGAALLFPSTEVTCCEIEPAVLSVSEHFATWNHAPEKSPRFSLVLDDGRSYLQACNERFDVIISEPSNPWLSGVSNLFTREFYEIARDHLESAGVLAQWIQTYSISPAEYTLIVRTMLEIFTDARLVRISEGDTVLLASMKPLAFTAEKLVHLEALITPLTTVRQDLLKYFGTESPRTIIFTREILDRAGLERLVAKVPATTISTDLNMRLEFDAPLRLFDPNHNSKTNSAFLLSAVESEWFVRSATELGCGKEEAAELFDMLVIFDEKNDATLISNLIELGLRLDPDHADLLIENLLNRASIDMPDVEVVLERLGDTSREANRLGVELYRADKFEAAALVFERLVEKYPRSVTIRTNLGLVYRKLERKAEAEAAFKMALELDPVNEFTLKSMRLFEKEKKTPKEAEQE